MKHLPRFSVCLAAAALLALPGACGGTRQDPGDEEFYYAEAKKEYGLAQSYLLRAQHARKKQVEYLELAETQEALLRELRAEIAKRRADNNKRAQQVEGLKKEAAALAASVKAAQDGKTKSAEALKKLQEEKAGEEAALKALQQEIAALKAKQKAIEAEKAALREAFGAAPAKKDSK